MIWAPYSEILLGASVLGCLVVLLFFLERRTLHRALLKCVVGGLFFVGIGIFLTRLESIWVGAAVVGRFFAGFLIVLGYRVLVRLLPGHRVF